MSLILLSTVGATDYEPTEYQFETGAIFKAEHFVFALAQYLRPDKVVALLTDEALILQWQAKGLQTSLQHIEGVKTIPVRIPTGANENDLWKIFDAISEEIPQEANLVLDITHGFRSLPMVMLTAASYLQQSRAVQITGVYYGAFHAVDKGVQPKPVFNIGPFMTLLDWNNAVDAFNRTGDCSSLARQLNATQHTLYKNRSPGQKLPTHLKSVAAQLENLSSTLDLVRPDEIMATAYRLIKELREAEAEFAEWAKPFNHLLAKVREQFEVLALSAPDAPENLEAYLERTWQIVKWYKQYGRLSTAALLARELAVSWYMYHEGCSASEIRVRAIREEIEERLGTFGADLRQGKSLMNQDLEDLINAFGQLSNCRNDLAHTGMREKPDSAKTLGNNIKKAIDVLGRATGYIK